MSRFYCKACSFRYEPKGNREPNICPACGRNSLIKDFSAQDILNDLSDSNFE